MNCKQGDLAVIVRSSAGNEGKIVRCLSFLPSLTCRQLDGTLVTSPAWVVDRAIFGWDGYRLPGVRDALLRPIRDSDGQDEMLRLVGLPAGTPVDA